MGKKIKELLISTSDRKTLSSCPRKFDLSSFLRQSYAPKAQATPLWFGNLFHFILEDYYGYKKYSSHEEAVKDYTQATMKHYKLKNIPQNYLELSQLAVDMAKYYIDDWCKYYKNNDYYTLVIDGKPMVEIGFKIKLPIPKKLHKKLCKYYNVDKVNVYYKGIIDRLVTDKDGFIYILDYKTCGQFSQLGNIKLDKQVGAYFWAISKIPALKKFDILGFIYQEHKKKLPSAAKTLKNGGLSLATNQAITPKIFKDAAIKQYGAFDEWPKAAKMCLQTYKDKYPKNKDGDNWIKQTIINKSTFQNNLEIQDILNEVQVMINPESPIYRSVNMNCTSMCSFDGVCMAMNSNQRIADSILKEDFFKQSYSDRSNWNKYLKVKPNEGKENG